MRTGMQAVPLRGRSWAVNGCHKRETGKSVWLSWVGTPHIQPPTRQRCRHMFQAAAAYVQLLQLHRQAAYGQPPSI